MKVANCNDDTNFNRLCDKVIALKLLAIINIVRIIKMNVRIGYAPSPSRIEATS